MLYRPVISQDNDITIRFTITDSISENSPITDKFSSPCYTLVQKGRIDTFYYNSDYKGKVLFEAKCDTVNMCLTDYKLVFAKLRSDKNPIDSIEVRLNNRYGNCALIDSLIPGLIKHISYLNIEKTNFRNCESYLYRIPIYINNIKDKKEQIE